MSELKCKYKNELNKLNLSGWTNYESDLFFLILAKAKNQGTEHVYIGRDEILNHLDLKKNPGRIEKQLEETIKKFTALSFVEAKRENGKNIIVYYRIFSVIKYEWKEDYSDMSLDIQLDKNYEYLLNFFDKGGFTVFELKEYLSLDSFYSKQAYKLIKQYRTQGVTQAYSMKEFRELFCVPKSYTPKKITYYILRQIEEELGSIFPGLNIEQLHEDKKQKQRTTGYRFRFIPEKSHGPYEPGRPKIKRKMKNAELPEWYYAEDPGHATAQQIDEIKRLLERTPVQKQEQVQDTRLDDEDDGLELIREVFGPLE